MEVRLLTSMSGPNTNHLAGEVVDFDNATAARLIKSGQAEAVAAPPAKKERATAKRAKRETAKK